ncbi:hypothetical protein I6J72_08350 [Corynebacterium sp. FDAARGOS 1242]|uniref:hypothetical protein n=1 Tax=unclassified Corynebacterium TaxID=2624378 RepID=UPI0008A517F7|nr:MULTISPECIES: hypothetical protein [unclassified Corynebacterium]OFR67536.1 hypothetical protein HMPREF2875_01320 [Corynebacterium sp. HMSC078H07]QRP97189.1 hypothetical protein I6J72_08350 [Corynebacterium sp. FDAARGOS 1242]
MKRMTRTLTAVTLSGALALGGTAVASAQVPAPAELVVEGTTYYKQDDGTYKSATDDSLLDSSKVDEALAALQPEDNEEDAPSTTKTFLPDVDASDRVPGDEPAAPSSVDYPIADGSESESEFDTTKLAWLALPAALVIGGVTWYLAKDGKTYVKSQEAAQKDAPTAEEKAESAQLLEANKDEVIAQGGKIADSTADKAQGQAESAGQAQSRGISAETGSNTVARGLAALAIAAMIAAGAFVARRKLFI